MFDVSLTRPNDPNQAFLEASSEFILSRKPRFALAGFAFASIGGAKRLFDELPLKEWEMCRKKFLLGLNQGITEPAAIDYICSKPNTEVRLFSPSGRLDRDALCSTPLFHPKTILLYGGAKSSSLIYISSANLTSAAIGAKPSNYECGLSSVFTPSCKSSREVNRYRAWWKEIWDQSLVSSPRRINAYSKLRLKYFDRNPDTLSISESSSDIIHSLNFWIEVGKASGIERHQIEFPEYLARFFGGPERHRVNLVLTSAGGTWQNRPISYKKTSFGVQIWRLGMPTVLSGGVPIQDRVIKFTRTKDPLVFSYEVDDVDSEQAIAWLAKANRFGHTGRTRGSRPRKYGYF